MSDEKKTYTIKQFGIWQLGKLRGPGETVDLTDEDRERIDPEHLHLQSKEEAALEAKKLAAEAKLAAEKAKALADIDAKHKAEMEKAKAEKGGGK